MRVDGGRNGYDSLQIGETMFVTGVAMFLSAPSPDSLHACWICASYWESGY
jgi:hypothetical protein